MDRSLNYAVEQRLRLIDFLLLKYGNMSRDEICAFFGVSMPQATRDMKLYKERAPSNCVYDPSVRRYLKAHNFFPLFSWGE